MGVMDHSGAIPMHMVVASIVIIVPVSSSRLDTVGS